MHDKHKYLSKMYFPIQNLLINISLISFILTVYEQIEHGGDQTVHGGDDGAGLAHVRGDVNETLRHVIEANVRDLRHARGRNFVTPVVMREGYGGV